MWLSEARAIWLYDAANIALIIGLVLSAVATVLVVWMGDIKEAYLKTSVAETTERAANLENQAAQARLEVERLQKELRPRELDREAFFKALEGQPKAPVQILYLKDDRDSMEFAQEIENNLKRSGWTVTGRAPIPPNIGIGVRSDIPTTMSVGGQPSGVTVVTNSVSNEEEQAGSNALLGKEWVKTPWTVLRYAFLKSMGTAYSASHESCPKGILRVVVGPRR